MLFSRRQTQILRRLTQMNLWVNLRNFIEKNLRKIVILFLILDVVYSFVQHAQTYLDGDMANIVMPSPSYNKVLTDPFGLSAMKGEMYPGPNRYFAHASMSAYFKTAPFLFQYIDTPINSIYWACALIKTLIQVLIIMLFAAYISEKNVKSTTFLIAAALITPLFQTAGYNGYIGIIDRSITYNFFYSLPLALLLLYFLPFYKAKQEDTPPFSFIKNLLIGLFTIFLSFNGPLIQPIVLLICPSVLLYKWYQLFQTIPEGTFLQKSLASLLQMPKQLLIPFVLFGILSLYSIYLGFFNIENLTHTIPLFVRYARLPQGLYYMYSQKLAFPLFSIWFFANILIINKFKHEKEAKSLFILLKWVILFAFAYLLLLPLGGYRNYRPYIVRYDTFMPILFALMLVYGKSTLFIINHLVEKQKAFYLTTIIVFSGIMTFADKPVFAKNACEKAALASIAQSPEKIVALENDCTVMAWGKITDPNYSETNAQLLHYWGVTKELKLYYQK